jgi:uncharacterized protein (TIGR03437 family)
MGVLRLVLCGLTFAAACAAGTPGPSFAVAGVVNASTGQTGLAPYSICTLYGSNLYLNGTAQASGQSSVPNQLGGVTVQIGLIQAGLFFVSANQINFLIPNSFTPGDYTIRVVRDGMASATAPITIQEVAPGLFASSGFLQAFHADGTAVTAQSVAVPGEIVVFYGTGLGRAQPDPGPLEIIQSAATIVHAADFQVLLDGAAIDPTLVQYVGVAPLSAGLYQMNVQLPDNLSPANPNLQVSVAGLPSPYGVLLNTGQSSSPQPVQ